MYSSFLTTSLHKNSPAATAQWIEYAARNQKVNVLSLKKTKRGSPMTSPGDPKCGFHYRCMKMIASPI